MKISMYSIKNNATREYGVPFPASSEWDAKFQVVEALKNQSNIDLSSFSFVHSFIFDTELNKMHHVGHTLCSVAELIAEFGNLRADLIEDEDGEIGYVPDCDDLIADNEEDAADEN